MAFIGNLLWFIFGGGLFACLAWCLLGCLLAITVVGIPFAKAAFRIAGFAAFPFGKELIDARLLGEERIWGTSFANFLWVALAGLWLAISHTLAGITCLLAFPLIFPIFFGFAHFKLAMISFAPLGKRPVSKDLAAAARMRHINAQVTGASENEAGGTPLASQSPFSVFGVVLLACVVLTCVVLLLCFAVVTRRHFWRRGADQALSPLPANEGVGAMVDSRYAHEKYMYYFPEGPTGPLMIRAELTPRTGDGPQQFLQNDQGNYCYRDGVVHINNYRMWSDDLAVVRLPTDSREMMDFLTAVEGKATNMSLVAAKGHGLLVVAEREQAATDPVRLGLSVSHPWAVRHFNVPDEGYFAHDWSAETTMIDNRDQMHARGWTYFAVTGHVGSRTIVGTGQIPFTYAASKARDAWLILRVGSAFAVEDCNSGASVRDGRGMVTARYPHGSFFKGLGRPWMGLHTIDTIRRDAAQKRLRFRTQLTDKTRNVRLTVQQNSIGLVYTIDLETDVVAQIEIIKGQASIGHIDFQYIQDLEQNRDVFRAPSPAAEQATPQEEPGILWLVGLAEQDTM
jgi:uncharacterized membrane protein YccF (DUF307 family)